jgi:hypothetical protein
MLTNITWNEFAIILGIIVFAYYAVLLLIFNRKNIFQHLRKINGGSILLNFQDELRTKGNGSGISTDQKISEFFNVVTDLQNEIKDTLELAGSKKYIREEIILLIQTVLRKYNSLELSPFKNAIDSYLIKECQNYCSIHLEDRDINQVWIR